MDGSKGVPLDGATVTLRDAGLVAKTDAKGRFSFDGVAVPGKTSDAKVRSGENSSPEID